MTDTIVHAPFQLVYGPLCGARTASCPMKGKKSLVLLMEWRDGQKRLWTCFYKFVPDKLRFEFQKMERWPHGDSK